MNPGILQQKFITHSSLYRSTIISPKYFYIERVATSLQSEIDLVFYKREKIHFLETAFLKTYKGLYQVRGPKVLLTWYSDSSNNQ